MQIDTLKVQGLRNLHTLNLAFLPGINVFYGNNGSGKTSILEAIYFLGHGKSFRSHLTSPIISHEQDEFVIYAERSGLTSQTGQVQISPSHPPRHALGIACGRDRQKRVQVDGETDVRLVDLIKMMPIQLINTESHALLLEGPRERRQFLDWGLFHVEPTFYELWQRFQRVLKQRNAALRMAQNNAQICSWNAEFLSCAEALDGLRKRYFEIFEQIFAEIMPKLLNLSGISLEYYRGWAVDKPLKQLLDTSLESDKRLGYTYYGPQRADIRLKVEGHLAEKVLSRGQMKQIVIGMRLSQGIVLKKMLNVSCIFLIDDLMAELDKIHMQNVLAVLKDIDAQVFMTFIERKDAKKVDSERMFHVKQGVIEQI